MSYNNGPKIVTSGLVMYLDAGNRRSFVSGSSIWTDITENKHTGSLLSSPVYTSSFGGGITFNGTSYVYYDSTPAIGSNILRTVTLSVWFSISQTQRHFIFTKMNSGTTLRQYSFIVETGNQTYFTTSDSSGEQVFSSANNVITPGSIYHWTGTIDRTNRVITQYLNGQLLTTSTATVRQTDMANVNEPLTVGGINNRMRGTVYSAMIYNRVLTANEARQNYNATKGRFGL